MFAFAADRPRRRPGLTPLIDVVFLLLVFFMLAAQFGREVVLPISGGGAGQDYEGPPRLVTVGPDSVDLNGAWVALDNLPGALAALVETRDDIVVLRPVDEADVQRVTRIVEALAKAGYSRLILAE